LTLSDFIARAYIVATGEVSTLTTSDDDYEKLRQLANINIDDWSSEPGVSWRSLYSIENIGAVTATDTFDFDTDTIREISNQEGDNVRLVHADGTNYTDYALVAPERLKDFSTGPYCAVIGATIVFNRAFVSTDPQFGGAINVPCFLFPDLLVNSTDTVPVDIAEWLVYATAAEFDRTDLTRQNLYPGLVAKANDLMIAMKQANSPQITPLHKDQVSYPNGSTW